MSKIGQTDWQIARMEWETTPDRSLADVARTLGVSRPAVTQRAQRENWRRLVPDVAREELAQATADVLSSIGNRADLVEQASAVLDLSVQTRVLILNRHRADWQKHHELFTPEMMAGDPTAARRGKLAAETLALRQRGEAIAYGMTDFGGRSTDAPIVEQAVAVSPGIERLLEAMQGNGGNLPQELLGNGPPQLSRGRPW